MECFTFILMGGTTEQIEVLLLAPDGDSAMRDGLIGTFRHFDASKARCFLQEDTDRLLGTIEGPLGAPLASSAPPLTDHHRSHTLLHATPFYAGGFGSVGAFSKQVSNVLETVVSESMANQAEAV